MNYGKMVLMQKFSFKKILDKTNKWIYAINNKILFIIFVGENEKKSNKFNIKIMASGNQVEGVEFGKLAEEIKKLKENKWNQT